MYLYTVQKNIKKKKKGRQTGCMWVTAANKSLVEGKKNNIICKNNDSSAVTYFEL